MSKRNYLKIVGITLGMMGVFSTQPSRAQDSWSVGVSCEIEDLESDVVTEVRKTSSGPYVMVNKDLSRGEARYRLYVDASDRYSRGVIHIENLETGSSDVKYGPVSSRESFELSYENWRVTCEHWPYIAD